MAFVVMGLGNPDDAYRHTRHNVGKDFLIWFHGKCGFGEWRAEKKKYASCARGALFSQPVIFVVPTVYMNQSGKTAAQFVRTKPARGRFVVVHDDMDIPAGKFKLSFGRGSAGHRGIESIMRALGSKEFFRIRIGVSHPARRRGAGCAVRVSAKDAKQFVLGRLPSADRRAVEGTFEAVAHEIGGIIQGKTRPPRRP